MCKKSIVAIALIIITLITIIGGLYYILNDNNKENSSEELIYVLKKHQNTIAVFIDGKNEPYITLDVAFNNLPFNDKELLVNGIYSKSLSEIMKYAEDYDG